MKKLTLNEVREELERTNRKIEARRAALMKAHLLAESKDDRLAELRGDKIAIKLKCPHKWTDTSHIPRKPRGSHYTCSVCSATCTEVPKGTVGPKQWEVWCEGHGAQGSGAEACFIGAAIAVTFREACLVVVRRSLDEKYYDAKRNTYWGCGLFDNEDDARKQFG